MRLSAGDVHDLIDAVIDACPALREVSREKVAQLIGVVITETNRTNKEVELRIAEAGSVPPEISMSLMHYGALLGVVKDLPPGNPRRALVEAGEKVGAFIAKKFGEKIKETLVEKTTKH